MRLSPEHLSLQRKSSRAHRVEAYIGAIHVAVVVLIGLSLLSAGLYVYTVNRGAVQGYAIRTLEKELKALKKVNTELRVQEAEAKSLQLVEAGSVELRMEKAEPTTVITARTNTIALH